jgi:hypothetical protein
MLPPVRRRPKSQHWLLPAQNVPLQMQQTWSLQLVQKRWLLVLT